MKKIKLGKKIGPMTSLAQDTDKDEMMYPQMTISHPDAINIPDSGTAMIKHKVVSRHIDHKHKNHSVTMDIHSFHPQPKKKTSMSDASAMQGLMDTDNDSR